jgi:hypothetical protein
VSKAAEKLSSEGCPIRQTVRRRILIAIRNATIRRARMENHAVAEGFNDGPMTADPQTGNETAEEQ